MSTRRYNSSIATGNFTGATTGAQVNGNRLHIGESQRDIVDLAAHIIATVTMTNALMKAQWQGSDNGTDYVNVAHSPENPAGIAVATGVASGNTLAVGAPPGLYGYKYGRCAVVFTSTTAGTTNDAVSVGYTYRQVSAGDGV
jgi:hypothetical protein